MSRSLQAIPSLEDWKNLPGRSHRKDILIALRREFDDKEIREVWNMKPVNYYNLIGQYGLEYKGRPEKDDEGREFRSIDQESQEAGRENVFEAEFTVIGESLEPARIKTDQIQEKTESEIAASAEPESLKPPRRKPGRKPGEQPATKQKTVKPMPAKKEPAPMLLQMAEEYPRPMTLPFPSARGKPAQLRKQLEAVVMFLEAMENEDTVFEISIAANKI